MQPVLVLAPVLSPTPEGMTEIPPAAEGAFLASLEEQGGVPDVPVGPPVMLAVPGVPAMVLADVAGQTGPEPESEVPHPGSTGEASAVLPKLPPEVAEAAVGPPVQGSERPAGGASKPEPQARTSPPAEAAPSIRSPVAVAALSVSGPLRDAGGSEVAGTVGQAVAERAPGRSAPALDVDVPVHGRRAGVGTDVPLPEGRAGMDGGTTELARAAPAPAMDTGQETPPAGSPQVAPPNRTPGIGAQTDGREALPAFVPARTAPLGDGENISPDNAAPSSPQPAPRETEFHRVAGNPPKETAARPGLWENMFSGLSLLTVAEPAAETGLRQPHPGPANPLLPDGQWQAELPVPDAAPTVDPDAPLSGATASKSLPVSESIKQTAGLPGIAAGLAILTPPGGFSSDPATDDAEVELLAAGGIQTFPAAPGGVHGPAASLGPQSSPVPQAAQQIAGALLRSADGATELALSPEELGHVRLRLEPDAANPDRMVVMITFERPETLDLFRRHAGELAEALRAAGYAGADIGFGQNHTGPHGNDAQGSVASQRSPEPPDAIASAPTPSLTRHAAGASLDLRL